MGIWNDIRQYFTGHDNRVLHTRYGDFNLAKEGDRRKVRKMVVNLQRTTDALTRKDIQDWRNAWQLAINVDSPNRKLLYDIYRDVDADLHLSGCIEQRKGSSCRARSRLSARTARRWRKRRTTSTKHGSAS